jgi:hypothetical protein
VSRYWSVSPALSIVSRLLSIWSTMHWKYFARWCEPSHLQSPPRDRQRREVSV